MIILKNEPLAKYTAFAAGGRAARLIILNRADQTLDLAEEVRGQYWVLGYGTNCLISDKGLNGTVIMMRSGPKPELKKNNTLLIDAATSWDEAVEFAGAHGLWGVELMSGIPGNTGAALVGNIAAYGQAIGGVFCWAEVLDLNTGLVERLDRGNVEFSYRETSLGRQKHLIVLRVTLELSGQPTTNLEYASALRVAEEMKLPINQLSGRRKIILEARKRAGSIYYEAGPNMEHTAGSFFKNPLVDQTTAEYIAGFDESGKSVEELLEQNRIHGGEQFRVSAAHVLLAAGFKRGQSWGPVRLHPKHVLKIENTGGAMAQQIYDVAQEIITITKDKLGVTLEPEVQFLGDF